MTHDFYSQYIKPFQSKDFSRLALGIFIGLMAVTFLNTHLIMDMARLGFNGIIIFLFTWLGLSSSIFFPVFYLLLKRFGRKPFFIALCGLQTLGAILLLTLQQPTSPFLTGLTMACFSSGFWQMFHLNITGHSSRTDTGFQMILIKIIGQCASIFGVLLISLLHLDAQTHIAAMCAFFLQAFATLWLMNHAPRFKATDLDDTPVADGFVKLDGIFKHFKSRYKQMASVALSISAFLIFATLFPVWLNNAHISRQNIGFLLALQGVCSLLGAPFVSRLIQNQRGQEFALASFCGALGWGCLVYAHSFLAFSLGSVLCSFALMCLTAGIEARWYGERSAGQIVAREMMMNVTRLFVVPLVVWFAFSTPQAYPLFAFGFCLVLWPLGKWVSRVK